MRLRARFTIAVLGFVTAWLASGVALAPRIDQWVDPPGIYVCIQFPEQPTICH